MHDFKVAHHFIRIKMNWLPYLLLTCALSSQQSSRGRRCTAPPPPQESNQPPPDTLHSILPLKRKQKRKPKWQQSYAGFQGKNISLTIIFSYLTFEIMIFGMKNWKKWPHGKEILKLRACLSHFPEVRPVLACHIHSKKCHLFTGNLPLELQGVGTNLPPEHIEGTKENPMATQVCNDNLTYVPI